MEVEHLDLCEQSSCRRYHLRISRLSRHSPPSPRCFGIFLTNPYDIVAYVPTIRIDLEVGDMKFLSKLVKRFILSKI